jgi:hypothetical protein
MPWPAKVCAVASHGLPLRVPWLALACLGGCQGIPWPWWVPWHSMGCCLGGRVLWHAHGHTTKKQDISHVATVAVTVATWPISPVS